MPTQCLDFETPIYELERKIHELKEISKKEGVDFSEDLKNLTKKAKRLEKEILEKLNGWQRTQLARHPDRPYALDYINHMTTDFVELHGDRKFGDGYSIVGGLAKLDDIRIVIIGHQKGRGTKDNIHRNFGMSHPEGYRKALRLMELADKFKFPIITLLDTPGAYPGIKAEERGQAEAVATNIKRMFELNVPIVSAVIGEGGSGGALAIGVGNRVLMLKNAVYSVISPEGCAAILWGDNTKMGEAADALCITSKDLMEFKIIDEIVKEPLGGAHKDHKQMASILRRALRRHIKELCALPPGELKKQRYTKYRNIGRFGTAKG